MMVPAVDVEVRLDVQPATVPVGRRVRREVSTMSVMYLEDPLPNLPTLVLAAGIGTTRSEIIRAEIPLHDLTSLRPDTGVSPMVLWITMIGTALPCALDAVLLPTLKALAKLSRPEAGIPSIGAERLLAAAAVLEVLALSEDFLSAHLLHISASSTGTQTDSRSR